MDRINQPRLTGQGPPELRSENPEESDKFTLAATTAEEHPSILRLIKFEVKLNQDKVISTMVKVEEARIETSFA